jgi:hypothetical protein
VNLRRDVPHDTQARRTNARTSEKGKQNEVAYNRGGIECVWQMKVPMTLVLVLLLGGCAAGKGDGAGSTTTVQETATHSAAQEETTVLAGPGGIPRPPDSTLSYGGREVTGMLGTYCWDFSGGSSASASGGWDRSSASAGSGCVDYFDIPIPPEQRSLAVPSGSEMVFRYGGQSSPKMGEVKAYPRNKLHKKRQDLHPTHRSLQAHGSGVERTIPAKLPPGDYVVDVYVEEPPDNQVGYYFRVMVE